MWLRLLKFGLVIALAAYCVYYLRDDWHPGIDDIDLAVHEMGHIVFSPLGRVMTIAGGSLFQLLVPLLAFAYFWTRGQKFSGAAVLMWLSLNFFSVGRYARDAVVMQLPLVGFGDVSSAGDAESGHDWHNLLFRAGLLEHTPFIASSIYVMGYLSIAAGLYFGWRAYMADRNRDRDRDRQFMLE